MFAVACYVFCAPTFKSSQLVTGKEIPLISKKIRLSDDFLSWEHERFAVSRHPAVTLSHLAAHLSDKRHSVFDDR